MKLELDFKDSSVELPKKSGDYICITKKGYKNLFGASFAVLCYSKKHQKFNVCDTDKDFSLELSVLYWADVPKKKDSPWLFEEEQDEK